MRENRYTSYIYKVSWIDLPAVLFRLIRSKIILWKNRSPKRIEALCNTINPFEIVPRGEWLEYQDMIFAKWEKNYSDLYEHVDGFINCAGASVDYKRNILQAISIELQNFLIFVEAAKKDASNKNISNYTIIPPSFLVSLMGRELLCKYCQEDILIFPRTFTIAYYLKSYIDLFTRLSIEIARLVSTFFTKQPALSDVGVPIIWAGTTPNEVPSSINRLNFSWAVTSGALRNDAVLYLLPIKPSSEQENYLEKNNLQAIPRVRLVSILNFQGKLSLFYSLLLLALSSITAALTPEKLKKIEYAISSVKWIWITNKLKSKAYLGSSSVSWPEQPEVAVMNAMGVNTITWMYSANTIGYSPEKGAFNDDGVERSTLVSKEYWVWSGAVKKYLQNRTRSDIYSETDISVVGPMMCGNPRYLQMSPVEIRSEMGIRDEGYYIGIFDVTIHSPEWMSKYASSHLGDSKESLDAFYKGVLSILNVSPDIKLLIKPKRKNDLNLVCDEYLKLTDEDNKFVKDGQVILLDPYMDPYLPIAAADACIGMPFTSPVLAALSEDRNGIYYDPCYTARYPGEPEYKDILVHKEDMLLELVKKWRNSKYRSKSNELILSIPPSGLYENIGQQLIKCY